LLNSGKRSDSLAVQGNIPKIKTKGQFVSRQISKNFLVKITRQATERDGYKRVAAFNDFALFFNLYI